MDQNFLVDQFFKGEPIMWPLLLCLPIVLAILIERLWPLLMVPGKEEAEDVLSSQGEGGAVELFRQGRGVLMVLTVLAGPTAAVAAPPEIAGPASVSFAEHDTTAVSTFTATDPDGDAIGWLLAGDDAGALTLGASSGVLRFAPAPNYEAPADTDADNGYEVWVIAQDDGTPSEADSVAVAVTVTDVDDPGTVSLSSLSPQVGVAVTATLTDEDGQVRKVRWTWQRRLDSSALWDDIPSASDSSYTPVVGDVGYQLRAKVKYSDRWGGDKKVTKKAPQKVVDVPGSPALSAAPGDGQVGLRWTAPASDGGRPITDYEYWYSQAGGFAWTTVGGGASADSLTVTGLTNGQEYTFAVRAVNALGAGLADSTKATPQAANAAPVIAGSSSVSVSFAENDTSVVSTFTATDPEGDAIGWSLAGTDAGAFTLGASSGVLRFAPAPNYEAPTDTDADNGYEVWVIAQDDGTPSEADSVAVAVTVTDVDDPGTLTLTLSSASPQVGVAVTATLTDEDGQVRKVRWTWQRRLDSSALWDDIPSSSDSTYTPVREDVGYQLRAKVKYSDRWGGDKKVTKKAPQKVVDVPGPPALSAAPGDGQVGLRWTAPASDGGRPITDYEYWYSDAGGFAWTTVGGASVDSLTVTGLTNGQEYTFAVRAVNELGAGLADSTQATPQAANAAPEIAGSSSVSVLFAEHDTTAVDTFTATDPEGDAIGWLLAGDDAGALTLGASSGVLRFAPAPNYEAPADTDADNGYEVWVIAQDDGTPSEADSVAVAVTVTDVDDPGTVSLSSSSPQVGVAVTATLTDEDGQVRKVRWTWQRRLDSSALWADIPSSSDSTYTPVVGDVGYQLRAKVKYSDRWGGDKKVTKKAPQKVVDVPGPPVLSAAPGDGQVGLRWTAPASDGGRPITDYEYWYSDAGGFTWTTVGGGASADSLTVTGLTNGQEYTFAVRAVNELGAGLADSTQATPQVRNQPPEIAGSSSVSVLFAEHDTTAVSTFTATDPDGDAIEWILAGADASVFSVGASSGVLRFDPAPNYEAPADTDADNGYQVWVIAQDDGTPAMADSVAVTATVTDVEEDGLVALSSLSPQVGVAVTATLTDEDGQVTGAGWTWQRRAGSSALWADIPSASDSSYTPVDADVDYQLRATVVYSDRRGGGKQASSEATPAVIGVPRAPALSASAGDGDGQVALRWTAPASDGGSPITDYEYWYSDAGGFTWTTVGGGASADSLTVTGLTNGQEYTFAVRAVNALGAGLADSTKATPHAAPVIAGPASVSVSFAEQDTTAVSTFTATDPEGDAIGWSLAGTDASAFSVGASSGVLRFDPVPNYEAPADNDADNVYEVWVVARDDGTPSKADSVAVAVTVTDVDDPGTLTLSSLSPQEGVALTATLRDEDSPLSAIRFAWSAAAGVNWEAVGTSADLGATSAGSDTGYVFTPTATLVGFRLRVQATYTDPHGSYIKYTPWTEPVFGTTVEDTGVVNLSSTSPQVREALTATLSDPDGTIYGAAWTWQRRSGSSASWADIPSSGASSPDASYTPVEGDVGYHLRARVRYRDDHGAAQDSAHSAATNAVQANVPCAPGLSAKLGDGQVALRWTAPPCDGGSSITHYQYRQEAGSWTEVPGDGSTREHIVSGLTNGTLYTFAVRAVNAVGAGAASNSASATPTDMIAYYPFNGDAQDASGNEYHGTLSGPVPTSDRFGNEASAILFNGTNHRINLPRAVLNGRTNVSVAFWLKTSKTGTQSIISGANQNNENEYLIYFLNKSKLSFYSHGAGPGINEGRCDVTISSIADGYWHHFAVIRNDSQGHADIFIDGTSYTNRCRNLVYNRLVIDAGGLIIGQEQDRVGGGFDASQVFRGALDDLRIYGKALSATEVQALSSEPNPKKVATREKPATSGLTLNFPNPFNASIQITYRLATSGPVRLEIYNVLGQPVKTLVEEFQTVGSYQIHWDARDQRGAAVATGVYFTRLLYPGGVQVRRLLYLK